MPPEKTESKDSLSHPISVILREKGGEKMVKKEFTVIIEQDER